ncbi:DNA-binding protein [Cohnella luojiensis]|nr:DNA-binding protein [Cohnella luojiensis]
MGFLKPGQIVHLRKNSDNRAEIPPIGKIGYVVNSTHTCPKGCRSVGRIYNSFVQRFGGTVRFVIKDIVIVELAPNLEEIYLIKMSDDVIFTR